MALYNEVRPHRFKDLVGNERLIASLLSQIVSGTLHHSYLFYGMSGTGKTTTARLLAATLCCSNITSDGGCGICSACKQVATGGHWDVLELDGAHIRGVEDIDQLVYKAHLYPITSLRKVYIIDECHRLSKASWDVTLKLLEEPPPFFTIILCTTEVKAIPETVISRCSLCHFDTPSDVDLRKKLDLVCSNLGFPMSLAKRDYCVTESKHNYRRMENLLEALYAEYITEQVERAKGTTN